MKKAVISSFLIVFVSFFSIMSLAASNDMRKKEGEIVADLMVVNKNEISAAELALKRSSNPGVRNFAEEMLRDHGNNLQMIKMLSQKLNITPEASRASKGLMLKGRSDLAKLQRAPSGQFNRTYMESMVMGHEAALGLIDNELLPKANKPAMVAFLNHTRATVSHHLQMAKSTLNKL